MGDSAGEVAFNVRAEHAEGPLWDAATARLWWVDITGKRVHCSDPESGIDTSWNTAGQPGGVVLDRAGEPVVASPDGMAALDRRTGELDLRIAVEQDRPENRASDAKVDGRGRAWVGTMAFDKRPPSGALYRVSGDQATRVVDGLTISNGPPSMSPMAAREHRTLCRRRLRHGRRNGRPHQWPALPRSQRRAGLARRDDGGRRRHAVGRAGAVHAIAPTAHSRASSNCRPRTRRRCLSVVPTAASSTSPPLGSTWTTASELRNRSPARSSAAAQGDRAPLTEVDGRRTRASAPPRTLDDQRKVTT
jgi:SMP-30/Gluconolactonase/LRE-like region